MLGFDRIRNMQKVVVTGGAGFVGSHLTRALLERGYEVHVIDNYSAGKREDRMCQDATYHQVDIRNTDALPPIFEGAAYVFHAAAQPRVPYSIEHPQETNDNNITGTLNVLVAAKDAKVKKVVYSASSSAYGDQDAMPLVETMSAKPKSPYGLQKYVGELYARVFNEVYGLPTVSLRYFNVYGPGADPNGAYALVIGKFILQRTKGESMTITGDGTQTRDFTHVRDIVAANILAAESDNVGKGEVINIGAGKNASINRVAELIGGPVERVEARLEPHDTLANNAKARELIGWQPTVSLEEGIAELKQINNIT